MIDLKSNGFGRFLILLEFCSFTMLSYVAELQGNLKQHMLTHKIRDMEQDNFRNRALKYVSFN